MKYDYAMDVLEKKYIDLIKRRAEFMIISYLKELAELKSAIEVLREKSK